MKHFRLCLLFILSVFSLSSFAQTTIRLSGKIINQRNQPIAGATVAVSGVRSTPANSDGDFSINVPAGKYTLTISAVGYQSKEVSDIEVKAGVDNTVDIVLDDKKSELDEVVVRSTRRQESTNTLLTFQKNNIAMSSGLAADFIRRTPDKNTGEVLRRVSGTSIQDNKYVVVRGLGDRYNSALINGAQLPSTEPDKKVFSFDVIPSQLIDNIIINKTATPDLTGEFAGGLVQVTTKDIPTRNFLSFNMGFGFNSQSIGRTFTSNPRGSRDWLGFDDGQRSLTSLYPRTNGVFNTLSPVERNAIAQDFNDQTFQEQTRTAGPIQSYAITWANAHKYKNGGALGTVVGINYRNQQIIIPEVFRQIKNFDDLPIFAYNDRQNRFTTTWGALANIAYAKGRTKIAFKNIFNRSFEDNYYKRTGRNDDQLQDIQMRSSVLNQRSLYSGQLELSHTFKNKWRFSGNLNYANNQKEQPDMRIQTFQRTLGSTTPYSLNTRGNNTNRFWSDLDDQAFGWQAKMEVPFALKGSKQMMQFGGGSLARIRQFEAIIFAASDPLQNPALLFQPFDKIFNRNNFGIENDKFQYITDLQNPNDKYFGASVLSNAFLMFDNKLSSKWRLVWGARAEYFELLVATPVREKSPEVNSKQFDLLPSANLTFSPNRKTNVRFATSRTVARQEFREVAPFGFFDFEELAQTSGNPNLRRSSIVNLDLRYEYYPKAGEVLSVGAFYKNFTDPIELRLNSGSGPSRRIYEFQNAQSAYLLGTEVEFRKSLGFLDKKEESWLDNLYFNGNATLLLSEVTLTSQSGSGEKVVTTNRPLQGQSPYLINAGFQYDGQKGFNFSLLYNIIGQRLRFVGNDDFGDIYEKPRHLLDLQFSQKILKRRGEVRFVVSDLLNQNFVFYEKPVFKEATRFDPNIDRVFNRFTPGTTYTIGFTYDINLK